MKMRLTLIGEYEVTDNPDQRIRDYGTTDPTEMAAIDQEGDVALLLSLCEIVSFKIEPVN